MNEIIEANVSEENLVSQKKTVKIPAGAFVAILASVLTVITCLSAAIVFLAAGNNKSEEVFPEPDIESVNEFIPIVNNRVYDFYSEDDIIILDDAYYGQIWLNAFTDVPKHTYDYSGLVLENGRYTYSENGEIISKTGIDVSYHQGEIDWHRVAADGIDFAILRVGYRGYESGALNIDENFHTYIKGALDAGIDVGVYFFSQAVTTEEAIEEANFVMEQIQGYEIKFPVVFDWEIMESEIARTNETAPYTVTACAAAFCDTISDGGYKPMVYGSRRFALLKLDMSKLAEYDFWYAEYKDGHNAPLYPYDFKIWQYASDGKVDGINGDVDLNICFTDYYGMENADLT